MLLPANSHVICRVIAHFGKRLFSTFKTEFPSCEAPSGYLSSIQKIMIAETTTFKNWHCKQLILNSRSQGEMKLLAEASLGNKEIFQNSPK